MIAYYLSTHIYHHTYVIIKHFSSAFSASSASSAFSASSASKFKNSRRGKIIPKDELKNFPEEKNVPGENVYIQFKKTDDFWAKNGPLSLIPSWLLGRGLIYTMVSFDGNIDRCLKRSISTALLDHNSRSYHNLILARRRSSPGRMSSFAASSSGIHRAVLTRPNVSSRQRLRQATEASLPSSGRSTRPIITKVQRGIPQSSVRSLDGSTSIVVKAPP